MWVSTVGAAIPLLAKRFGIDPALVSAPLISTLVDATGLVIFYNVAIVLLIKLGGRGRIKIYAFFGFATRSGEDGTMIALEDVCNRMRLVPGSRG